MLETFYAREDSLFTSYPALGEVAAGAMRYAKPSGTNVLTEVIAELGFSFVPFDESTVAPFAAIRSTSRIKTADAMQLACASSVGADHFLTGDKQLIGFGKLGLMRVEDFQSFVE